MEKTLRFTLEKETKGAARYAEVNDGGEPIPQDQSVIGSLYIRKSALGGTIPQAVEVTVKTA